jgi:hypothetical protein
VDICFKIVLFFLFGTGYLVAMDYSQKARQFPQLIALITLILLALSFLGDLYRWLKGRVSLLTDRPVPVEEGNRIRRVRFYKAWFIIIVAIGVGLLGGFLFSTFFLLAGFPLFLGDGKGRRLVWDLSLAVIVTAFIYLIFEYMMGVPLLTGLLIDL